MEIEQRLGRKTFWIFVLSNSKFAFGFLLVAVILAVARGYVGSNLIDIFNYALIVAGAVFAATFLLAIVVAWLTYITYSFSITENAFKVKLGIFNKKETAIPYRQIQSVDLRQDVVAQIIGVSKLVVLTAGHDDNDKTGEAEIDFPVIDTEFAQNIQTELLKRAQTEKIVIQKAE